MQIISGLLLIFISVLFPPVAPWLLITILVFGFELITKQGHSMSNKMLMMPITVLSSLNKLIFKGLQSSVGSLGKKTTSPARSSGSSSSKTKPKPDDKPPTSPKSPKTHK